MNNANVTRSKSKEHSAEIKFEPVASANAVEPNRLDENYGKSLHKTGNGSSSSRKRRCCCYPAAAPDAV